MFYVCQKRYSLGDNSQTIISIVSAPPVLVETSTNVNAAASPDETQISVIATICAVSAMLIYLSHGLPKLRALVYTTKVTCSNPYSKLIGETTLMRFLKPKANSVEYLKRFHGFH